MKTQTQKLYANYGAYYPVMVLEVLEESPLAFTVKHEDGHVEKVEKIRVREARPTSGSPIGIYYNEMDAY